MHTRGMISILAAMVLLALAGPLGASADEPPTPDMVPPVLKSLAVTPRTVDVRAGSATVEFEIRAMDDSSGCSMITIGLAPAGSVIGPLPPERILSPDLPAVMPPEPSPGGTTFLSLSSGTAADGVWKGAVSIPRFAVAGRWGVQVSMYDFLGNVRTLTEPELLAAGFPSCVDVVSESDSSPPFLADLSLTPASIDVSTGVATVDIAVTATDDHSGCGMIIVSLTPPGPSPAPSPGPMPGPMPGPPTVPTPMPGIMMPVPAPVIYPWPSTGGMAYLSLRSGDEMSGIWTGTITIPRYAASGTWTVDVWLYDLMGNTRTMTPANLSAAGLPSSVTVASNPDTEAPELTGFAFAPTSANVTSKSVTVDIDLHANDALSGCETIFVSFLPPNSTPGPWPVPMTPTPYTSPVPAPGAGSSDGSTGSGSAVMTPGMPSIMPPGRYFGGSTTLWLSDGTNSSGKWRGSITIPQYAEMGEWSAQVSLYDQLGNVRVLSGADLALAGLPSTLTVVSVPDTTAPETFTDVRPGSGYIGSGLVLLTPTDAGGSGVGETFYQLDGGAQTPGTEVPVLAPGVHTIQYWSVDQAGNAEPKRTVTVTVTPKVVKASTSITIASSVARTVRSRSFVLSGIFKPWKRGDKVIVDVKRPGSTHWTRASVRTAYATTSALSGRWSYRYTPRSRGTYAFRVRFAGDATRKACVSRTRKVSVR